MLGVPRSTHQYRPISPADESVLVQRMVELATQYGRYGYRRITALLQQEGFKVNHKRVERLWRREGLKVPRRQPKRKRLWLNDGSCIRLRPAYRDHVWSYDFMQARTREGRSYRLLTILAMTGLSGGIAVPLILRRAHAGTKMFLFGMSGLILTVLYHLIVSFFTTGYAGFTMSQIGVFLVGGMVFGLWHIGMNTIFFAFLTPVLIRVIHQMPFVLELNKPENRQ